jgi:hypothetical protein
MTVVATTSLQFGGMNKKQFDNNPSIKTHIKNGVEASVPGITVDESTIVATDAKTNRRLSESSTEQRLLAATDNIDISFQVIKEVGSTGNSKAAFTSMTSAIKTKVADGSVSNSITPMVTQLSQSPAQKAAYTPPVTFVMNSCDGVYVDNLAANHFTADCSLAESGLSTCKLTVAAAYQGGSVTCDPSTFQYVTVPATLIPVTPKPTIAPTPKPSSQPTKQPTKKPTSMPTKQPTTIKTTSMPTKQPTAAINVTPSVPGGGKKPVTPTPAEEDGRSFSYRFAFGLCLAVAILVVFYVVHIVNHVQTVNKRHDEFQKSQSIEMAQPRMTQTSPMYS